MAVLVLAEVIEGVLQADATARAVSAARGLGEVHLLCAGASVAAAAAQAVSLEGVAKVLVAEDAGLAHRLAEPTSALLVSLADGYSHILAPATSDARNILPRVAALLDVMIVSDVLAIESADTFRRPTYAGNAIQTVQSADAVKVLTVRTTAFEPVANGAAAPVEALAVNVGAATSTWLEDKVESSDRPELTSSKIVVSGGRGVGSAENFAIINALADTLGAAVGASRAAVDSGYAPNDWQVGQTGKVVAPQLYIACGISGAIQHLAGMKDSKVIVAINKDADAPIFQIADYGLVGDLFEVVPQLTERLG